MSGVWESFRNCKIFEIALFKAQEISMRCLRKRVYLYVRHFKTFTFVYFLHTTITNRPIFSHKTLTNTLLEIAHRTQTLPL